MKNITFLITSLSLIGSVCFAGGSERLFNNEASQHNANRLVYIDTVDLTNTNSATAQTVTVHTVQADTAVEFVYSALKTAFDSSTTTNTLGLTLTVNVGTNTVVDGIEIAADGTEVPLTVGDGTVTLYSADTEVTAILTPTNGALSDFTRGRIYLYMQEYTAD